MAQLAVITGTTHGIGRVTATELARAGFHVAMLCRNLALAEVVAKDIRAQIPEARVDALHCDLSDLASVRHCAFAVRNRFGPLSLLILNAGMAATGNRRTATGMDLNFAVNHLGHFLLTELLRDHLARHGRIITVASMAHYRGKLDLARVSDPRERTLAVSSYARSKLANVLHSFALARRITDTRIAVNCLHPGVIQSNLLPRWVGWLQRLRRGELFDEVRGAQCTLALALKPEFAGIRGVYFDEYARPQKASTLACDVALQEALWQRSQEWVAAYA
jgi:NAD(P)-dependent dehydrogenase (short-subunit alcohol dehydrogenase family)